MAASEAAADRIAELAERTDLNAAEIHRRVRQETAEPIRYEQVRRAVKRLRSRPRITALDRSPSGMADRILSLLDRELAALERGSGRTDLERLDRIARTLRTVEPIRPKGENKKASSLRSLLPTADEPSSEVA